MTLEHAAAATALLSLALLGLTGCGADASLRRGPSPAAPIAAVAAPPTVVLAAAPPDKEACAARQADLGPLLASLDAPPPVAIERAETLAPFFDALAALDRKLSRDHVRIAVYGDSNLTMDFPTGRMRRVLSKAFGEGGHGFVAAGQPWSHYQHRDVRHGVISGWKPYAVSTAPTGDGLYGLGGIVVENEWQGATTFVETAAEPAPIGTSVARFEVFYLRRAGGGRFDAIVDGVAKRRVETQIPRSAAERSPRLGIERIDVPEGAHRLELVASSPAVTRLMGVALERTAPGIVIDTFGVGSLNTRSQAAENPALNAEMLKARRYDLVVFLTGANDVFTMDAVPAALKALVERQRAALPGVPILVVSPADRGARKSFSQTLEVVAQRQRLAAEMGVAYWSLFDAMGGSGSMAGFVKNGMANRDAIHWNARGGDWAGDRMAHALATEYEKHLASHQEAGCRPRDLISIGRRAPSRRTEVGPQRLERADALLQERAELRRVGEDSRDLDGEVAVVEGDVALPSRLLEELPESSPRLGVGK